LIENAMANPVLDSFIQECHENLVNTKPSYVISYLNSTRGLTGKTILDHKIGFCASREDIPDGIKFFGKEDPDLQEGYGYSYFIEKRITVPVYDEFGVAVGLATREPSTAKGCHWWNLPKPFYKSQHIFLLNKARGEIFKKNKIYIMEGYMDGLMAFQKGLFNVGVIMGTELTRRKIGLIARYCEDICFCLDTDENEAGQKATRKSILAMSNLNFCNNISTIKLPITEDPASFLEKNSVKDFLSLEARLTEEDIEEIKEIVLEEKK
jgi:DNA primase